MQSELQLCSSYKCLTWPIQVLHSTIEAIIKDLAPDYNAEHTGNIVKDMEEKVNMNYPINVKQHFDFCIISSQKDYAKAAKFQQYLCSEYKITGQVIWDCVPLGSDLFIVFEDMVARSTKLLFYVTESFDDSDLCALIAKNHIVFRDFEAAERKVIPLIEDFNTPIPDTFKLVDKIYLSSSVQLKYRFPVIFTPQVKQEKIIRTESAWKQSDEVRRSFIVEELQKMDLQTS